MFWIMAFAGSVGVGRRLPSSAKRGLGSQAVGVASDVEIPVKEGLRDGVRIKDLIPGADAVPGAWMSPPEEWHPQAAMHNPKKKNAEINPRFFMGR
jgi:hypothetical protein